jgi:hypothetical protein
MSTVRTNRGHTLIQATPTASAAKWYNPFSKLDA